jgi:hypothetical protein
MECRRMGRKALGSHFHSRSRVNALQIATSCPGGNLNRFKVRSALNRLMPTKNGRNPRKS